MTWIIDLISAIGPFFVDMFTANPLGTLGFTIVVGLGLSIYFRDKLTRDRLLAPMIVRHQMNKSDEIMDEIETMIMSDWLGLRKNQDGVEKADLFDDGEQHRFDKTLYKVMHKTSHRIRYFFHENHLANMNDDQARIHFQDRATAIWNHMNKIFDDEYWSKSRPTRIEHFESMQYLKPAIQQKFIEIFQNGRKVAIEFKTDKEARRRHLE